MGSEEKGYQSPKFLELSPSPIIFEPVSPVTNVFYDDANRQVFTVRSGGATGVSCKGPDDRTVRNFRMEDKGTVMSIKFSPEYKILAIQRGQRSVEFANYANGEIDPTEYSQAVKGKMSKIIGFVWTSAYEIVFVTDCGLELFTVLPDKRMLKNVKVINLSVNWFVFHADSSLLVLSSGSSGNMLHPFQFKQQNINKLPKFEVELSPGKGVGQNILQERDVTIVMLYGQLYISVLRQQPRGSSPAAGPAVGATANAGVGAAPAGAEIVLCHIHKDGQIRKTDILRLDLNGRFAISIVDNLVVVHIQASKSSLVFDIRLGGECPDHLVNIHRPLFGPVKIKPFKITPSLGIPMVPKGAQEEDEFCQLYASTWILFQPDVVIDAALGCLWYLHLKLEQVVGLFKSKQRLIDFLLLRRDSKMTILSVCKQLLGPSEAPAMLPVVARIFDRLNECYRAYMDQEQPSTTVAAGAQWFVDSEFHSARASLDAGLTRLPGGILGSVYRRRGPVIVDQSDMYTHVLSVFVDSKDIPPKRLVAVLIEYIRSLNQQRIPVQHYLYEILINTLVHRNCFYQLHQLLQYHVISDSKPLACLMLSLQSVYPPAHQLALDMLKRLGTANEEIVEVLLSKDQLLPALRFVRSIGAQDTISARKFLEAAANTKDDMTFYSIFKVGSLTVKVGDDSGDWKRGYNHEYSIKRAKSIQSAIKQLSFQVLRATEYETPGQASVPNWGTLREVRQRL